MDISVSDVLRAKDAIVDALNEGKKIRMTKEVESALGMADTYYLAKFILGYKDLNNEFHRILCRFHDANLHDNLFVLAPRKHFKTTCITIAGKIRLALLDPDVAICIMANTLDNSAKFLFEIKDHYINNDKFMALFPGHAVHRIREEGRHDRFTTPARQQTWRRSETFEIASAKKAVTSRHYDLLMFDDLCDEENSKTVEWNRKVFETYAATLPITGFTPDGKPWHHIVGTRWSFDDMYGKLLNDPERRTDFKVQITQAYWREKDETGEEKLVYLFPKNFPKKAFDVLRRELGNYLFSCTPGWATVWMADGTFKKIEDVQEGDVVVGFERGKKKYANAKIVRSVVKKVQSRVAPVVQKMTIENGDEVYCTPEHQWYTGRRDKTHRLYKPMNVGSRMVHVIEPVVPETAPIDRIKDWAWFGGMMDGEGGLTHGLITISQSVKHNRPVMEKLRRVLKRLGLEYNEFYKEETEVFMLYLLARRQEKVRILVNCNFAKHKQLENQLFYRGGRVGDCGRYKDPDDHNRPFKMQPAVVSIERAHENIPVYALVTETGNYVSQGYASSNCLYLNNPVPQEDALLDPAFLKYYRPDELKDKQINRVMTVDPAGGGKGKRDDPSVISVYDMDPDSNIYVREVCKEFLNPEELVERIIDMQKIWNVRTVGVEKVSLAKWLLFYLEKAMKDAAVHFNLVPITRDSRITKQQRHKRIIPYLRNGKIYVRENEPHLAYIRREFREYSPHIEGRHDHFLDTTSDAIELLKPPGRVGGKKIDKYRVPPILYKNKRGFQTGYSYRSG